MDQLSTPQLNVIVDKAFKPNAVGNVTIHVSNLQKIESALQQYKDAYAQQLENLKALSYETPFRKLLDAIPGLNLTHTGAIIEPKQLKNIEKLFPECENWIKEILNVSGLKVSNEKVEFNFFELNKILRAWEALQD